MAGALFRINFHPKPPSFPHKSPSLHLLGGREDLFAANYHLLGPNFPQKALMFPLRGGRGYLKALVSVLLGGIIRYDSQIKKPGGESGSFSVSYHFFGWSARETRA